MQILRELHAVICTRAEITDLINHIHLVVQPDMNDAREVVDFAS